MTDELRTIRLFGHLGRRFGREHRRVLDVPCPAQAVKALCVTLGGFQDYLQREHANSGFRVLVGGQEVGAEQLGDLSGAQEIWIVPTVRGGKSALGRIITGAALIVLSIWNPMGWAAIGTKGAYGLAALFSVGVSTALGGVAQLLAPTPNPSAYNAGKDGPSSYLFSGAVQAMEAGGRVPVLYGELEIPLTLISGSITPERIGTCAFGLGDGTGAWSGDGDVVPLAASVKG